MSFYNNIITPILRSIEQFPSRNAFCINEEHYTYAQFGQCVSKVRSRLTKTNYSNTKVGLVINDDLETYASIVALWLEGDCYVPLHPGWPLERCQDICEQVELDLILDPSEQTRYEGVRVINTSTLEYEQDCLTPKEGVSDEELAYILFTSGSTGVPKGVQLTRRNIAAFMDSFWQTGINITPDDRCMQVFDLTFDVSVQSYLVALTRGACVYTVPYGQVKYLYAASLIQEQHITFGAMAPSMLTYLRPYFDEFDASSMKACILTAEACPVDLMEAWYGCAKNTEIYDFYGPTEATIYCTYYKLTRGGENLSLNGIISIGKPLANVQAIIIREDGSLVEGQEKGELCVAGDQVTPGYWKNDEKNASSFFVRDEVRYYHTGDLCYWHESGNIMYSGRIDQQAKIQGFRVELGEIEHHARQFYSNERRVMAIAFQNAQNLTEIALFVESQAEDTKPLIDYLRSKMPHYMIPTRILFEPSFPLNKSEKVDRNALKNKIIL